MSTLDLNALGATPMQIVRGLAAAGDVIRDSGMSPEFIHAGHACAVASLAENQRLSPESWHWRASAVFEKAQCAALCACYESEDFPAGSELLIVQSKGPVSWLD